MSLKNVFIYFSEPVFRKRNPGTDQMLEISEMIGKQFSLRDSNDDGVDNDFDGARSSPPQPQPVAVGAAPPPPPPPPPPRPGLWRFPEAEFANKVWHR